MSCLFDSENASSSLIVDCLSSSLLTVRNDVAVVKGRVAALPRAKPLVRGSLASNSFTFNLKSFRSHSPTSKIDAPCLTHLPLLHHLSLVLSSHTSTAFSCDSARGCAGDTCFSWSSRRAFAPRAMADGSAEDSALQALLNGGDTDLADTPAGEVQVLTIQHDDEEDEYDPSSLVPDTTTYEENNAPLISTPAVEPPSQVPSRATSAKPASAAAPSKPRTVGGFAVDDSSDEEEVKPAAPVTNGTSNVAETAPQPAAAENISQPQAPLPSASPAHPEPQVSPSAPVAVQEQPVAGGAASPTAPGAVPFPAPAAASNTAAPVPAAASPVSASASVKPAAPTPVQTSQAAPAISAPTSAKVAKPVRLPNDRIGILEDRIEEDPRGDIEAWLQLVTEYRSKGRLDDARSTYNRFFQVFPHAVSYLNHHELPIQLTHRSG